MIVFERCADYSLLNSLLRQQVSLYPFLGDDFAPLLADAVVAEHSQLHYILARDEGVLLGFWMFAPDNGSAITWVFHTVMLLDKRALSAMKELLGPDGWLWANTPCLRAITSVASGNPIALRFGWRAGLTQYGRNPLSYLKNGTLQDQILLGISKPVTPAAPGALAP